MQIGMYTLIAIFGLSYIASARFIPDLPHITPAPSLFNAELRRRDDPIYLSTVTNYQSVIQDHAFVGWYEEGPGNTVGFTCSKLSGGPQTWSTSGTYGACCLPGLSCLPAATCSGNSLYLPVNPSSSSWIGCGTDHTCSTMTVYASAKESAIYNVFCASLSWNIWELTRDVSTTNHYPLPETPSIPSTTTTSPPTSAPQTTGSSSQPTPSKAWIAGPVLGGILAIVLFACLGYWLYRKGQKSNRDSGVPTARYSGATATAEYWKQMSPWSEQGQFSPQASTYVGEMDGGRQVPVELAVRDGERAVSGK